MVSPQDTYEAGPNGNEVLGPNPGTNILTTNHINKHHNYFIITRIWLVQNCDAPNDHGGHMRIPHNSQLYIFAGLPDTGPAPFCT